MKANELRIGNFVHHNSENEKDEFVGHQLTICELDEKTITTFYIDVSGGKQIVRNKKDYMPIPLTKKWFENFVGFQYSDGNYWVNLITHYLDLMPSKELWYPTYVQIPEFSSEEEQRVNLNAIQYVHELQNLYFTLTGVELQLSST